MMKQRFLNSLFPNTTWKGAQNEYIVNWCESCQTWIIGCLNEGCLGTSCNGTGCEDCTPEHILFNQSKTSPWQYLNDEEKKVFKKIELLKRQIPISLMRGEKEINWQAAETEGLLSELDHKVFEKEIKDLQTREILLKS